MEDANPGHSGESQACETEPRKMGLWLIVLLVVVVGCLVVVLVSLCTIVFLALLGPAIGNVFSDVVVAIWEPPGRSGVARGSLIECDITRTACKFEAPLGLSTGLSLVAV
jgi:hypothetical protein